MKFIKLDLLTLLIGLFLLSSCKDANTIGFELDPSLAIKGTLNNTLAVKSVTIKDDVTNTVAQTRQPLGYLTGDATFGTTEASLAFAVSLPSNGYSFGGNPIIDSAVLVLPYSRVTDPTTGAVINEFYGDTATSVYSFRVHQLKDDISLQSNFQSNREFAVETPVLGSFTAKIMPNTPVRVTDIVVGKPDTSRFIVPEIRIKLDNDFIQTRILALDSVTRAKNSRFSAAFKGLRVSVDKATSSGKGGIVMIDFAGSNANLQLYYKKDITNSVSKDTVGVSFPISVSTPVASNIKHDYTGTPVQAQLDVPNPATPYTVTYLQGLAGLRNKISFPDLAAFVSSMKAGNPNARIVINRAELVVNLSNGTDALPYAPSRKLTLYRNDIAGNRLNIIDYSPPSVSNPNNKYVGADRSLNGYYDATNKRYLFVLTSYLQNLVDGDTEDYGTFLSVSGFDETSLTPSILTPRRSVINTTTPGTGNNAIKLNIYYTKVN